MARDGKILHAEKLRFLSLWLNLPGQLDRWFDCADIACAGEQLNSSELRSTLLVNCIITFEPSIIVPSEREMRTSIRRVPQIWRGLKTRS